MHPSALSLAVLAVLATLLTAASAKKKPHHYYCPGSVSLALGSYTGLSWLPSAAGAGITLAQVRPPMISKLAVLPPHVSGDNPSYIAPAGAHLYAANENAPNGSLSQVTFLAPAPHIYPAKRAAGAGTTHVSVIRGAGAAHRIVLVANYGGGSVMSFVRRRTGLSEVAGEFVVPPQLAPKAGQADGWPQEAPHPHMVLPYGRSGVLVPDLGTNRVWLLRVNLRTGALRRADVVKLRDGDGPRHAALHRGRGSGAIYVVNELSLSLVVLRPGACGKGLRSVCQRRRLVGQNDKAFKDATAAAVRASADGRFLYVSVRKAGEKDAGVIVAFETDPKSGLVRRKVGTFGSGGAHPRDFFLIERVKGADGKCRSFLAVVNRDSNNLVLFERDMRTGRLSGKPSMSMMVKTPTSVVRYA